MKIMEVRQKNVLKCSNGEESKNNVTYAHHDFTQMHRKRFTRCDETCTTVGETQKLADCDLR